MKIVQTLWLPSENKGPITYRNGWLSPQYHWIGWALSCFLLKKHYANVELYTTEHGREILINQLKLPYSQVHILPNHIQITSFTWALAKLITYNLQEKPFIHIDGDIFIWKPFSEYLLTSPLIVQNAEINLDIYKNSLLMIQGKLNGSTAVLSPKSDSGTVDISYNVGIIGGNDVQFFKEYSKKSIDFVADNQDINSSIIDATSYCMLFEQYFFASMVMQQEKTVTTFFDEPVNDLSYPQFDDFRAMMKKGYLHLMGQFKLNRYTLKMLISELRQNYPHTYYEILRLCTSASVSLDYKIYQLPELNPSLHSTDYFITLFESYNPNFTLSELDSIDWIHYYTKDIFIYKQMRGLIDLDKNLIDRQSFCINSDFLLIEETETYLKQKIKFPDTCTLEIISIDLDVINMIIVDSFYEGSRTIKQIVKVVKPYFDEKDFRENKNLLQEIILERIHTLLHWGVIRWLSSE